MTEDENERLRRELTEGMMAAQELINILLESAEGLRAKMLNNGWSMQAAEQVALMWLTQTMPK